MLQSGRQVLASPEISHLIQVLLELGYRVLGPTVREGAVAYSEIKSAEDLPIGWTDVQEPGRYHLSPDPSHHSFHYTSGVQSWKKYLHPAHHLLFKTRRQDGAYTIEGSAPPDQKMAFLGVRACELKAIALQDRIFLEGEFKDRGYEARRKNTCIIAVNCTRAGGTCFCASMGTGPRVEGGYDLALTELPESLFVADTNSALGEELLGRLTHRAATTEESRRADDLVDATSMQMGRTLDTAGLQELLYRNYDHRRWEQVAARCTSCANCTMVCPTCFCTTMEDVTDLSGNIAERWKRWDSCFTQEFSYIHGGVLRSSVKSRYRQWLTHKLATWVEQFGSFGCVGCGRCITWCPVGIDLTQEVAAIRGNQNEKAKSSETKESSYENDTRAVAR